MPIFNCYMQLRCTSRQTHCVAFWLQSQIRVNPNLKDPFNLGL